MGSVVAKRKHGESVVDIGEATKQARQIGRLSLIINAMRPGGRGRVKPGNSSPSGPSSSSTWSKMFSNRATSTRECVAVPPASVALPGQDETKLARQDELRQLAPSDGLDFDDRDGKLKYDAEFVESEFEDPCVICNMYKRDTVYACRVCGRPFHHGCLIGRGLGLDTNSSKAMENAETDIGWSCPDCEALSELISMDDMSDLMIKFDNYDTDGDSAINLSNYMEYESTNYQLENNDCMPGSKVKECEEMFRSYDRDNDGVVSWWDYCMVETIKLLQREPQTKHLEHLAPKEIAKFKKFFRMSDKGNIGMVTVGESEQAFRGWLRALGLHETEEMMRSFEKSSWPKECNKMITWERFIHNKALALITSRPNTLTIKPYVTTREETAL